MLKKSSFFVSLAGLLLLSGLLAISLPGKGVRAFSGVGEGTSQYPYEISTCAELQSMNENLSADYVLVNDIDCSGTSAWNSGQGFVPIGGNSYSDFNGSLDGRNFTISGLYINNGTDFDGLFGSLRGTVQNVLLTSLSITSTSGNYIGGLAGITNGATISYSSVNGDVTGANQVGGLIGAANNSTQISNSSASGSVVEVGSYGGGLVGIMYGGSITNSFANTNLTGSYADGGLVAFTDSIDSPVSITDSYAVGSVSSSAWAGGFVGMVYVQTNPTTFSHDFVNVSDYVASVQQTIPAFSGLLPSSGTPTTSNIYFDQYSADTSTCATNFSPNCTAVDITGSQPAYFQNNNNVAPLSTWDFNGTWEASTGEYPILRQASLSSLNSASSPDSPQNFQVSSNNEYPVSLSVSWDEPNTDGGSPITSYTVAYEVDGSNSWTYVPLSSSTFSYSIPGYLPGQTIDVYVFASNAVGDGNPTDTNDYEIPDGNTSNITDCMQLQAIQQDPTASYTLENDIDCSDTVNWNSGAGFTPISGFTGTLEGNGYTISDLTIDRPNGSEIGMFADIDNGATVQDINFNGGSIIGENSVGMLAGTILGGTITNINSNVPVTGQYIVGGLIGQVNIDNVSASITDSSVSNSVLVLDPTSATNFIGGAFALVDTSNSGTLTLTNITTTDSTVGAINGSVDIADVGGVIGEAYTSDGGNLNSTNLSSTDLVEGESSVGGIIGDSWTDYLNYAWPTPSSTFTSLSATDDQIECVDECGGLIGSSETDNGGTTSITNSTSDDSLSGGDSDIGGLIGASDSNDAGTITLEDSFSTGNVNASGDNVGGLVGYIGDQSMNVIQTYATGDVNSSIYVGGLIGNTDGLVVDSYASGTVSGSDSVGGLVGLLQAAGDIASSFATGGVSSNDSNLGGLVGQGDSTITDSLYDATRTGLTQCTPAGDSAGCSAVNNGNSASTYFFGNSSNDPLGSWDFVSTWDAHSGILPTFQWDQVTYSPNISTCEELQDIQAVPYGNYTLTGNIDCSATPSWNFGAGFIPITNFTGSLNGAGYTIESLYMNNPSGGDTGLFRNTVGATIENLNFDADTNVSGTGNVGVVSGSMDGGTISDVAGQGTVSSNTDNSLGGLVGYVVCDGTANNALTGLSFSGEVVYYASPSTQGVGGIIGYISSTGSGCSTTINDSTARANISPDEGTGVGTGIGGLVGLINTSIAASNNVTIENSSTTPYVYGASMAAGGLVGLMVVEDGSTQNISQSYSSNGTIFVPSAGDGDVGGLVGEIEGPAQLYQTYSTNYEAGPTAVGGLVGYIDSSANPNTLNIDQSYTLGTQNSQVYDDWSTGGAGFYGGLVGYALNTNIKDTYTTESVYANDYDTGGLVGYLVGDLSNSYAAGPLNGNVLPNGGLVGDYGGSSTSAQLGLDDNFSVEQMTTASGNSNDGGLVGIDETNGNIPNLLSNYYDTTNAGTETCAWEQNTTAESCNTGSPASYKNTTTNAPLSGWDFTDVWYSRDNNYPEFQWGNVEPDYSITNCLQLQGINNDLTGIYTLDNNIDCSDTVNWNGGNGFASLGYDSNNPVAFTGTLDGAGNSISALFINQNPVDANNGDCNVGLFSQTYDATIENLSLTGSSVRGNCEVGTISGQSNGGTLSNVSVSGLVTITGNGGYEAGGLIGEADSDNSDNPITISTSSFTGTVDGIDNAAPAIGGLIGDTDASIITNDYANGTVSGDDAIGGLVGYADSTTAFSNTYSAGSIVGCDALGGLVGENNGTIVDSFSASSITLSPSDSGCGEGDVGGLVGTDNSSGGSLSNDYYDQTVTGEPSCIGDSQNGNDCSAVNIAGGSPSYFFNNSSAAPLDNWPFETIWQTNSTSYPTFVANPATTISTCQQLQNINNDLTASYILIQNIDCSDTINWNSGAGFVPLGTSSQFSGNFNGQGHTISGLYIDRPGQNMVGLFASTQQDTIDNFTLSGGNITGNEDVGAAVGFLYDSSIKNVISITTPVTASDGSVGGLVGWVSIDDSGGETLNNLQSSSNVTLTSDGYAVGGLIGQLYITYAEGGGLEPTDLVSSGVITTEDAEDVGGLIGYIDATGSTEADQPLYFEGGSSSVTIDGSGSVYVGGLIGNIENASNAIGLYNQSYTGDISSDEYTGGLIGQYESTNIGGPTAGLEVFADTTSGTINSTSNEVGGLIGYATTSGDSVLQIQGSSSTNSITDNNDPSDVGDLAGYVGGVDPDLESITQSFSTGTINTNGGSVGGLVGTQASGFAIRDSYSQSQVDGNIAVGGLVGDSSAPISDSYASGSVTANELIGGLVGYDEGTTSDSFSAGAVNQGGSATAYGGLVGFLDSVNGGSLTDTLYDATTSGQASCSSAVVSGCTPVNIGNSQPNYFFDNSTNLPLSNWSFGQNPWVYHQTTYPTFSFLAPLASDAVITATSTTDSITPSWSWDTGDEPAITSFVLQYRVNGSSGSWTTVTLSSPTALTATITGLSSDTVYEFELDATNSAGTSGWSTFLVSTQKASSPTPNNPTPTPVTTTTTTTINTSSNSSGSSASVSPAGETVTVSTASILLNIFSQYTNGTGKHEPLAPGQVVYFLVGPQKHSVTVDSVGSNYVTITIRSDKPELAKLLVGQVEDFQVDQAGIKVIQIKLISLSDGIANLSFKKLSATTTISSATNHDTMVLWLIILIVVLFLIYVIAKRRRHEEPQS